MSLWLTAKVQQQLTVTCFGCRRQKSTNKHQIFLLFYIDDRLQWNRKGNLDLKITPIMITIPKCTWRGGVGVKKATRVSAMECEEEFLCKTSHFRFSSPGDQQMIIHFPLWSSSFFHFHFVKPLSVSLTGWSANSYAHDHEYSKPAINNAKPKKRGGRKRKKVSGWQ